MRYIKHNYNIDDIKPELINSLDWDIIELNITFDAEKFKLWHSEVEERYKHLFFNIRNPNINHVLPDYRPENICNTFKNKVYSDRFSPATSGNEIYEYLATRQEGGEDDIFVLQMSWFVERDDFAIPFRWCADPTVVPEIKDSTLRMKMQEKYKFGYFKKVYDALGEDLLYSSCLRYHHKNGRFGIHTDGPIETSYRIHIPVVSHDSAFFMFGENDERQYVLEEGRAYLINAAVPHSTKNHNSIRSHLQTKVYFNDIMSKIIPMNIHID